MLAERHMPMLCSMLSACCTLLSLVLCTQTASLCLPGKAAQHALSLPHPPHNVLHTPYMPRPTLPGRAVQHALSLPCPPQLVLHTPSTPRLTLPGKAVKHALSQVDGLPGHLHQLRLRARGGALQCALLQGMQ